MALFESPFMRLGLLSYLVPPSEFSFASVFSASPSYDELFGAANKGVIPDYTMLAIGPFIFTIVLEWFLGWMQGKKLYRLNDTSASFMLGLIMLLISVAFKYVSIIAYVYVYAHYRVMSLPVDGWGMWLILFLGVDFGYYWMHRFAHTYHALWTSHSVHHSGEDYNLATALRQGAFQGSYSWVFQMPLAFFCHPACFIAHGALNTLGQFWIHTKLIGDLGPLEYVLNTPSHHRNHHRVPGNCNYAGILIIWDRLFGTFMAEKEQVEAYGLAVQYDTFDPSLANVVHAVRQVKSGGWGALFRRRAHHDLWFVDFMALFRPMPAGTTFARWTPTDNIKDARRPKTDFPQHYFMSCYTMVQVLLTIVLTLVFIIERGKLSVPVASGFCVALLWSFSCVGRLFDLPSANCYIQESVRLALLLYFARTSAVQAPHAPLFALLPGAVKHALTTHFAAVCVGVMLVWMLAVALNVRECENPAHKVKEQKLLEGGVNEMTLADKGKGAVVGVGEEDRQTKKKEQPRSRSRSRGKARARK